ncbi:hypothetical protein [Rhodopirellula bahusiensis]|uniref:hypothetical protein n=1 Tax=Rhodopirellula bahusiensis TaxID=2014065 RepID=UPI003264FF88
MPVFDIQPRLRAGKLTLGADRTATRALMESLGFATSHSRDGMDYYDDNSIQLDFFDDDVLHFIGFAYSPNFDVSYCDNDPFDRDATALFQLILANEPSEIPFNDYDPFFPSQIIALWDAQEQYDYNGDHKRPVFATFSMGDQRYRDEMLANSSGGEHGVYAEALRAHLPTLATRAGLGAISDSSCIVRFVQGGVVKTFRCAATTNGEIQLCHCLDFRFGNRRWWR